MKISHSKIIPLRMKLSLNCKQKHVIATPLFLNWPLNISNTIKNCSSERSQTTNHLCWERVTNHVMMSVCPITWLVVNFSFSLADVYILQSTLASFDRNFFQACLVNHYVSSTMDVAGPSQEIPVDMHTHWNHRAALTVFWATGTFRTFTLDNQKGLAS